MKKRFLAALLALCMVFALGTVSALATDEEDTGTTCNGEDCSHVAAIGTTHYNTLAGAIDAAEAATTDTVITLLNNVAETIDITKSNSGEIILDFGGKELEVGRINLKQGTLTVRNGTLTPAASVAQPLNIYGATEDKANSELNIESNLTIMGADYGICLFNGDVSGTNKYGYGAVVNFNGKIISDVSGSNGIFVSGNLGNSEESGSDISNAAHPNVININSGSEIDVTGDQGIAMNGQAIVNVKSGASITGREAIGVKRGVLNITGGTFVGNGTNATDPVSANNNGTEASGAAISVTSTYNKFGSLEVNISGGSFTSANSAAVYVGHSKSSSATNAYVKGFDVNITDGTFKTESTNENVTAVFVADKIESDNDSYNDKVVTGGRFLKGTAADTSVKDYIPDDVSMKVNETTGEVIVDDTRTVATVDGVGYPSLQEAIDAADASDTVELKKDVPLTTELSITKNITIDGNGKNLTLTATANSQGLSIGAEGPASEVTLDDVNLTITGTQNINADGIDVWGTLNLKNSAVSISDLRSAFVMQGGASAKLNISNSTVSVKDITGNGTNGGYVDIDDSDVTFDKVGSHGLSVEEVTVTDSSLSFTDVAYCALYGQEIVLGSGADVEIEDCFTVPPFTGYLNVKYQAPVQVKVVAGDTDNGITVNSGASLTVTGTNDEIYIPKGTGFVSNGYVSADIVLGDTDMSVVTFVKNSTRQIKLVEDGKEIKLPDPGKYLGREFVGWECSLNDRVYPEGYEYKVTRDVTFTAVWETADYDIVIDDDILHGDIWTSPKSEAEAGDTVHVYADPDAGYVLEDLSVTYRSGRYELQLTRVSANHYTFTMPAYDVYVTAEFTSDGFPFDDVRSNQWFYDAVYYVWANDLMEGVDYDEFNPNGTMTRAMFWAVLGRIDGETITGSDWADEARDWAMSEGVSDGTNPNGLVTREQMVTMLWRYAGERDGSGNLSRYTDGDKVAQYATEAMRWALGNGIIEGTTATTLEPQATATRAQCAAIFMRYYE